MNTFDNQIITKDMLLKSNWDEIGYFHKATLSQFGLKSGTEIIFMVLRNGDELKKHNLFLKNYLWIKNTILRKNWGSHNQSIWTPEKQTSSALGQINTILGIYQNITVKINQRGPGIDTPIMVILSHLGGTAFIDLKEKLNYVSTEDPRINLSWYGETQIPELTKSPDVDAEIEDAIKMYDEGKSIKNLRKTLVTELAHLAPQVIAHLPKDLIRVCELESMGSATEYGLL